MFTKPRRLLLMKTLRHFGTDPFQLACDFGDPQHERMTNIFVQREMMTKVLSSVEGFVAVRGSSFDLESDNMLCHSSAVCD